MIRTRFAPSPTGRMHVGNFRGALYNYLFARQQGGKFLLRIEDTDQERLVEGGMENIVNCLHWAGIEPDEGVTLDKKGRITQVGDYGPYIQSERLQIYQKHVQELLEKGHAYHCFCTAERLEKMRAIQQLRKLPTGYDGFCRNLTAEEVKAKLDAGEKHVVRLKMPKEGVTKFVDLIRGEIEFKNELVDDQVLLKTDGFPTYHMAVVVDDHLMKITHVIRGEEWVSSTPKHIQLYKFFGWDVPEFAHLSLLLNPDKTKLSKRQGDVAVEDYKIKGYLPEALINFVAFLGWNPGTEKEIYSLDEFIKDFDLSKVNWTGAIFNHEKLDWYNQQYLRQLSLEELAKRAKPWLGESGLLKDGISEEQIEKAVGLERERVKTLAELPEALKFVFELPHYEKMLLIWKKGSLEDIRKVLPELRGMLSNFSVQDWNKVELERGIGEWVKEKGYTNGSVLWPLRTGLSGQQNSPGPFEIAEVLGKEETIRRLDIALSKIV